MFGLARILGSPTRRGAPVLSVANAMLEALAADGQEANLIRLQRLLVLAQCRSLAQNGEPLFEEQVIVLGDTAGISAIHTAFRRWSTGPIREPADHPLLDFPFPPDGDERRLAIIRETVEDHRETSGFPLGALLRRILPEQPNATPIDHDALRNGHGLVRR